MSSTGYCQGWRRHGGIETEQRYRVENAFKKNGVFGLFHKFLNKSFFRFLKKWKTDPLYAKNLLKSTSSVTIEKLNTYLGLEMAMFMCNFNHLTHYWCKTTFLGNNDFTKTMGRNDFQNILSYLKFYPLNPTHTTELPKTRLGRVGQY